jgi:hypothetical protein
VVRVASQALLAVESAFVARGRVAVVFLYCSRRSPRGTDEKPDVTILGFEVAQIQIQIPRARKADNDPNPSGSRVAVAVSGLCAGPPGGCDGCVVRGRAWQGLAKREPDFPLWPRKRVIREVP